MADRLLAGFISSLFLAPVQKVFPFLFRQVNTFRSFTLSRIEQLKKDARARKKLESKAAKRQAKTAEKHALRAARLSQLANGEPVDPEPDKSLWHRIRTSQHGRKCVCERCLDVSFACGHWAHFVRTRPCCLPSPSFSPSSSTTAGKALKCKCLRESSAAKHAHQYEVAKPESTDDPRPPIPSAGSSAQIGVHPMTQLSRLVPLTEVGLVCPPCAFEKGGTLHSLPYMPGARVAACVRVHSYACAN